MTVYEAERLNRIIRVLSRQKSEVLLIWVCLVVRGTEAATLKWNDCKFPCKFQQWLMYLSATVSQSEICSPLPAE